MSARLAAGPMLQGFIVSRRCEGSLFSGGERSRLSALQLWRQGHVVGVMMPARWTGSRFAGSTASCFSKIGIAGVLARGQWENGKGMEVPMLARHDGIHPAILAPDKLPELLIGGLA